MSGMFEIASDYIRDNTEFEVIGGQRSVLFHYKISHIEH